MTTSTAAFFHVWCLAFGFSLESFSHWASALHELKYYYDPFFTVCVYYFVYTIVRSVSCCLLVTATKLKTRHLLSPVPYCLGCQTVSGGAGTGA